jgi:hypothetical protein
VNATGKDDATVIPMISSDYLAALKRLAIAVRHEAEQPPPRYRCASCGYEPARSWSRCGGYGGVPHAVAAPAGLRFPPTGFTC